MQIASFNAESKTNGANTAEIRAKAFMRMKFCAADAVPRMWGNNSSVISVIYGIMIE